MRFPQAVSAWRARSLRERSLMLSLAFLIAALAIWYGVALPLRHAAAEARMQRDAAAQNLAEVELALGMNEKARGAAPLPEGGLAEAVEASATVSGIDTERVRTGNPGEITVKASGIEPSALFAWIKALEKTHGVHPTDIAATRDDDGFLNVELRFAGVGG